MDCVSPWKQWLLYGKLIPIFYYSVEPKWGPKGGQATNGGAMPPPPWRRISHGHQILTLALRWISVFSLDFVRLTYFNAISSYPLATASLACWRHNLDFFDWSTDFSTWISVFSMRISCNAIFRRTVENTTVIFKTQGHAAFTVVFQLLPKSSTLFTYNCKHVEITKRRLIRTKYGKQCSWQCTH